jgi:endonuclease-3 related protein
LYALHHAVPVADEYLRRIAERHQLIVPQPGRNRKGYEALAALTRQAFAADGSVPTAANAAFFNEFHALAVTVGKSHCGARPHCNDCPLASDLQWIGLSEIKLQIPLKE